VALPGARVAAQLTILGGLTTGGISAAGIFTLDVATGALSYAGSLGGPLHDAAGAALGGRDLIMGGGSAASVAAVQAVPASLGQATTIGRLPQPRSDSAAAVIGPRAFIVGGYDGVRFDAAVLATTDGTTFRAVATLPVPVRYPAVAALGGRIYVFGGQTSDGASIEAIQMIDPNSHTAHVTGHLPVPVTGSSAVVVQGTPYVLGGVTSATGGPAPEPTIWAFDPATATVWTAGHLQLPVSHASVAVIGSRAWIVGGEGGSGPVAAVQMLTALSGASPG